MQQEFLRLDKNKTGTLKLEDLKKITESKREADTRQEPEVKPEPARTQGEELTVYCPECDLPKPLPHTKFHQDNVSDAYPKVWCKHCKVQYRLGLWYIDNANADVRLSVAALQADRHAMIKSKGRHK